MDSTWLCGPSKPEKRDREDYSTYDAKLYACLGYIFDGSVCGGDVAEIVFFLPDVCYGSQECTDANTEICKTGLNSVEAVAVGKYNGKCSVE